MTPPAPRSWLGAARPFFAAITLSAMFAGCRDQQSVLAPRGDEAERIHTLTLILFGGGTLIFVLVMALVALAWVGPPNFRARLGTMSAVFAGGVIFPAVTLTALLIYGLILIRPEAAAGQAPVEIDVEGEQWWWRVSTQGPDGREITGANEVHVPVGRPVRLTLTTRDVIHSFWVPNLAGKIDMIPGRTHHLQIEANQPGEFRGQCAEYCGGAHAKMALRVVALAPADYDAWLEKESSLAAEPVEPVAIRGKELFLRRGCPACHAVSGIPAVGVTGPNLTHVAGRRAIAAETLPMSKENLARWIAHNQKIKLDNGMPSYASLPDEEIEAMAAYLAGLE